MYSRYRVFLTVLKTGSFTKAAEQLGYTQSAISQSVRSLENELGTTLLARSSQGLAVTSDGQQYLPYIRQIDAAEEALSSKRQEMDGLISSTIRIGTFTSISRNILPLLIREFQNTYPDVRFELIQGEYNSITEDILAGKLDFGFVNPAFVSGIETIPLFHDTMMAVLPKAHPLASKDSVSLKDLVHEPFIELDEGEYSVAIEAFHQNHLEPDVRYKVTDDYSILAMVQQSLGYSILYRLVLAGFSNGLCVRPIREQFHRTIALAWRSYETMPKAARLFADYIRERTPELIKTIEI